MAKQSFTSAEFHRYLDEGKLMATRCNACQKIIALPTYLYQMFLHRHELG